MTPEQNGKDPAEALRDSLRNKIQEGPERPRPEGGGAGRVKSILSAEIAIRGPGLPQMAAFCRQLAMLIDVGIPLVRSLHTLSERVEHPKLKKVVGRVAKSVEEGNSFSAALEEHPKVFSPLIVSVARIGETGGILETSMTYLADLMERRNEIRMRVRAAMAYPMAALAVAGLTILVILGFAMPVFKEIYEGVELPGVTRFVLGLSSFVEHLWWAIILAVVGFIFLMRYVIRTNPAARKSWDLLKLKMPGIGGLVVKICVARTTRTVANLLRAGIPLLETLSITADTAENVIVSDMLVKTHDNLERGGQLDVPMRKAGIFPDLVIDMIAIGDEAGRLDIMFDKIAETYDNDVDASVKTFNAIIEPAMIIVLGGIVAVLALAVLMPYWKISQVIQE